MADRYLLESGSPDGYQLEDGSGVVSLERYLPLINGAGTTVVDEGSGLELVTKTTATSAFDSYAYSPYTVSGSVRLKVVSLNALVNVGFRSALGAGNAGYNYALEVNGSGGYLAINESGAYDVSWTYTAGEILWIDYDHTAGTVAYYRGATFGTATQLGVTRTGRNLSGYYVAVSPYFSGGTVEVVADAAPSAPVNTYTGAVSGGIVFAGTSTNAKVRIPAPSGGLVLAGTATRAKVRIPVPSGGLQFAGAAAAKKVKTASVSGGLQFAGAAASVKVKKASVSGGVLFAGTSTQIKIKAPIVNGGLLLAGSGTTSKTKAPIVSGGVLFAGSAAYSEVDAGGSVTYTAPSPTGGVAFSGSSLKAKVRVPLLSGGVAFGGTASYLFAEWVEPVSSPSWTTRPPTSGTWGANDNPAAVAWTGAAATAPTITTESPTAGTWTEASPAASGWS